MAYQMEIDSVNPQGLKDLYDNLGKYCGGIESEPVAEELLDRFGDECQDHILGEMKTFDLQYAIRFVNAMNRMLILNVLVPTYIMSATVDDGIEALDETLEVFKEHLGEDVMEAYASLQAMVKLMSLAGIDFREVFEGKTKDDLAGEFADFMKERTDNGII